MMAASFCAPLRAYAVVAPCSTPDEASAFIFRAVDVLVRDAPMHDAFRVVMASSCASVVSQLEQPSRRQELVSYLSQQGLTLLLTVQGEAADAPELREVDLDGAPGNDEAGRLPLWLPWSSPLQPAGSNACRKALALQSGPGGWNDFATHLALRSSPASDAPPSSLGGAATIECQGCAELRSRASRAAMLGEALVASGTSTGLAVLPARASAILTNAALLALHGDRGGWGAVALRLDPRSLSFGPWAAADLSSARGRAAPDGANASTPQAVILPPAARLQPEHNGSAAAAAAGWASSGVGRSWPFSGMSGGWAGSGWAGNVWWAADGGPDAPRPSVDLIEAYTRRLTSAEDERFAGVAGLHHATPRLALLLINKGPAAVTVSPLPWARLAPLSRSNALVHDVWRPGPTPGAPRTDGAVGAMAGGAQATAASTLGTDGAAGAESGRAAGQDGRGEGGVRGPAALRPAALGEDEGGGGGGEEGGEGEGGGGHDDPVLRSAPDSVVVRGGDCVLLFLSAAPPPGLPPAREQQREQQRRIQQQQQQRKRGLVAVGAMGVEGSTPLSQAVEAAPLGLQLLVPLLLVSTLLGLVSLIGWVAGADSQGAGYHPKRLVGHDADGRAHHRRTPSGAEQLSHREMLTIAAHDRIGTHGGGFDATGPARWCSSPRRGFAYSPSYVTIADESGAPSMSSVTPSGSEMSYRLPPAYVSAASEGGREGVEHRRGSASWTGPGSCSAV